MSFAPEAEPSTEAETSKKSKKGPVWKQKHLVIEQINELIDELDEIDGNIALQAGLHSFTQSCIQGMSFLRVRYRSECVSARWVLVLSCSRFAVRAEASSLMALPHVVANTDVQSVLQTICSFTQHLSLLRVSYIQS